MDSRRVVWVLPVTREYDRVLEVLREGGREIHIVYSSEALASGKAPKAFADRVRDYLRQGPFDVKTCQGIDDTDLAECIAVVKSIVQQERTHGDDPLFRINIGTSTKAFTIASLFVAGQEPFAFELYYPRTQTDVVAALIDAVERTVDASRRGRDVAKHVERLGEVLDSYRQSGATARVPDGYEIVSIPVIPMQRLSRTQEAIMRALFQTETPFESASALAEHLFEDPERLGAEKVQGAKSSVSFALQALLALNLVELRPVRNRKEVHLSNSGRLYCDAFLDGRVATATTADSRASRRGRELA